MVVALGHREESLPWFARHVALKAAQDTIALLGLKGTLLSSTYLDALPFSTSTPKSLFMDLISRKSTLNLYRCVVVFLPRWRTQHLFLLIFDMFPFAQLSSLSRAQWMAAEHSGVSATPPTLIHTDQVFQDRFSWFSCCLWIFKFKTQKQRTMFCLSVAQSVAVDYFCAVPLILSFSSIVHEANSTKLTVDLLIRRLLSLRIKKQ